VGYRKWREHLPAVAPLIAPAQERIAMLPLQVVGTDANAATTADGLFEILSSALSGFEQPGGKIMAIPASEIRRRGIATAEEARRVYGANLAIMGNIERVGKSLRVTLNLVDTGHSRQVDSRTFDYDPASPVASRNGAVEQMAHLLNLDFTPAAQRELAAGDSAAPAAYTFYFEGRGLLSHYDVAGNLEKAIASFNRALSVDPNYALARSGLGEAYWRKARISGDKQAAGLAVENAEEAAKLDPNLAIVHSILGEIYGTVGREQEAIAELRKAIEIAPSNAEAPRELARIYANQGRFADAEALYIRATQSRPTDWYCHFLLGAFYFDQQRYQEAEAAFHRALALAPDNEISRRYLGANYLQQGRYQEAIRELQQSLSFKPNPGTYLTLGATYYYQHRFGEAVSALETAIDLDAEYYVYWGNLGIYYKWTPGDEGKAAPALGKAIELAEKLLEVTPNNYDIYADLAEYHARLGDAKKALAEIGRIPEPERKVRASRLAIVYELTGNRAEAIKFLRSSLTNPASLNQIKDDPDLAGLWKDPSFQSTIPQAARSAPR
jgi:tetratricopeptide (TPR) repeat protein/TolB-like protein